MPPQFISNREEYENLVISMKAGGWSIRALARHFKVGRNSIRRILRKVELNREHGHDKLTSEQKKINRSSKLDAYVPKMKELLEKYPKITGVRMLEKLKDEGCRGSITIIKERLRVLRPRPKREPIVRFETDPGVQGQFDWSPYTIDFKKGGKTKILCFSYILGFSRRQYIDFTTHRDFFTLIRRHVDTFQYFGGVPLQCLYDNEKTVVLRWEAGHPVFNPAFIAFITHYQCKPIACRPRRPETKGKIEAPFQYVENNFLNARTFIDMEDVRSRSKYWLTNTSDPHIHDTTKRPPFELFTERERDALQALPIHPYDTSQVILRVCSGDGFVEFEANKYSVPYDHIGDILAVKVTDYEVLVYNPFLTLIAQHPRIPDGTSAMHEDPAHRYSKSIRYGLEPVRESFLRLGAAAEQFIKGLKDLHPRNCGFHARLILQLKEHYNAEDIEKACAHALRYHAFDADAVARILKARAVPRTLEAIRNKKAGAMLEKILPIINQRPLEEYGQLFEKEKEKDNDNDQLSDQGQDKEPPEDPQTLSNGEGTG